MTAPFFWAAGALSAIWLLVHCIVSGRQIAQPLVEATSLDPIVRHTQYLCWHFTSVGIAAMAGFFLWAAASQAPAFAISATLLAAGFFVVGVALVWRSGGSHLQLPQGWLFLPVAILGLAGLLT